MQAGSCNPSALRLQNSLLVFLAPSVFTARLTGSVRRCRVSFVAVNDNNCGRPYPVQFGQRQASSAAAAAKAEPEDESTAADSQPRPRPHRAPAGNQQRRESSLLERLKSQSSRQQSPRSRDERENVIESILGPARNTSGSSISNKADDQYTDTADYVSKIRAAGHRRDFAAAQGQKSRQGMITRNMNFPDLGNPLAEDQDDLFQRAEATRAVATIKSRPSIGRTVEVMPERGFDLGRAIRSLEINCAVNNVKGDSISQKFHERPGMKRKRLKSVRRVSRGLQWPALKESPKRTTEEPASPAKPRVVWKREVSGHWLEVRLGKRTKQETKGHRARSPMPPRAPHPTPLSAPQAPGMPRYVTNVSKAEALLGLDQPLARPSEVLSADAKPKKGIASLAKRFWGTRLTAHAEQSQSPSNSPTKDLLGHASATLRDLLERGGLTPPSSSTSNSNISAASIAGRPKDKRNQTFLRPANRRRHTGHSSSSSVRNVRRGNPPVNTPNHEDMYTGSDAQQYFRVELTDPNAPKYLPSEARRIGTPPLPAQGSKLRGFFFDYNAPRSTDEHGNPWPTNLPMPTDPLPYRPRGELDSLSPPQPPTEGPRSPGVKIQRNDSDIEWFRVKVAVIGEEAEEEGSKKHRFELNVPEHLPSSPLCPRNPKHRSGGKGVFFRIERAHNAISAIDCEQTVVYSVMTTAVIDPLLRLRQSIAANDPPITTTSSDPTSTSDATENLAIATHLQFANPQHSYSLDTPTRFNSSDKAVDLRSIWFAWQKKDVAIPDYIASATQLNEELGAQDSASKVQNLVFVERLDLITWLEGASEESEYIKGLESDISAARSAQLVASGAAGGVSTIPSSAAGVRAGGKTIDPRLQEIYNGERRTGDRNTVLRGIKPTVQLPPSKTQLSQIAMSV
ncbi:MAG: hypothetical protein Q9220_004846 [cf. Caloplaca sp. 1 TL-2023]